MTRLPWRIRLALLTATAGFLLPASQAAAQPPVAGPPSVIDGPNAAILRPAGLGMSISRDGTGGLVYLKAVGGVAHVFVARLSDAGFQAPVQVDAGLGGASSQPVIAAGTEGLLLVAFVNGGELYAVQAPPGGGFGGPTPLAGGAVNPAISMSPFDKAYLAFAVSGHNVRAAYYHNGRWAIETPPLNATPGDNAGTGAGRPAVAAAGDGIAIVAWGENGHIYSRRVWGTAASVVDERADGPPAGCTETSAGDPVVGAGGDSSYAPVAFQEQVTCAGQQQSRVLMNLLQGSRYDGITAADGLGAGAVGANDPQMAVTEYGEGWVTSARTSFNSVFGTWMSNNGAYAGTGLINSLANASPPYAVPAVVGYNATFIAWQQEPGSTGAGDIRMRYAGTPAALGPEKIVSSPVQGPTVAVDGIAAAGDLSGDAAVAWLQGGAGTTQVMVDQSYQPPTAFAGLNPPKYATVSQPVLAWNPPIGWGPMLYTLLVDGTSMGQTHATSLPVPVPLTDGRHTWQVIATNPIGERSQTSGASTFIDTVPPIAQITLLAHPKAGSPVGVSFGYADRPPLGEPALDASGVASVTVNWGDRTVVRPKLGTHLFVHLYRRPGHYVITLTVTDKAGNVTRVQKVVRVVKPKKPKKAAKGKTGG